METTKRMETGNNAANQEAIDFVKKGSKLIKVRSKFSKNERYFLIEPDELVLTYQGSRKGVFSRKKRSNRIYLSDIQEIRFGSESDAFKIAYGKEHHFPVDSQCFSIVIGEKGEMLDLIAPSHEVRDLWVSGIEECCQRFKAKSANSAEVQQMWAKELFREADKDKNGELSLREITRLLNLMNLDMDETQIAKIAMKKTINLDEFLNFLSKILKKREIEEEIFKKYDNDQMYWTKHDLHQFLRQEQKEEITLEQCEKIIEVTETCPDLKKNKWLGLAGFTAFLNSDQMNIKDPKCLQVYQDMAQPLSHYFIDSSHNTYLESDQLRGYSKTECYIKALKSGCRCVEMDVWDGDNSEPVICHGFTLTSKILFSDVIKVINKYAFCKTKFPLIVSIENHCSMEQQKAMAVQMKAVFKEKLFLDEILPNSNYLPPPSELMERIIIKCKKIPEFLKHDERKQPDSADAVHAVGVLVLGTATDAADETADDSDETDDVEEQYEIALEFSDCINICHNASFKSFTESQQNHDFKCILSFSEKRALKLAKKMPEDFIQHNKRQLSRIFPAGSRIGSTNYDPVPFWTVGCQVVALNYQTPDEGMQLNRGLFEDNGGCGYVLKPDFMRSFSLKATFSPEGLVPNAWHRTLKFKVLSGFCLPKKEGDSSKSILDPYVQVSINGVPRDKKSFRTKVISNNGFHPVWNEEFKFFVSCPQLALVHIQVFDHETKQSDVIIAQYCLPFRCLQQGYRTVHLKTVSGEQLPASKLFVNVSLS